MLSYRRSDHLEVIRYLDLDFARCVDTKKYTFGYLFPLIGGSISWKHAKLSMRVVSTMQAEFVTCFEAITQALWL